MRRASGWVAKGDQRKVGLRSAPLALLVIGPLSLVALGNSFWSQGGSGHCKRPSVPQSDSVLGSFLWRNPSSDSLHGVLYEATRLQAHRPRLRVLLTDLTKKHAAAVSASLVRIAHYGTPYGVDEFHRGEAAFAYGVLHSLRPDLASPTIFPAMLLQPYPDALRGRLVEATAYVEDTLPELDAALAFVLCQAAYHIRSFVRDSTDLKLPAGYEQPHWYKTGVWLLRSTVNALTLRPTGRHVIAKHVSAVESNPVLARQIERWASDAVPPPPP